MDKNTRGVVATLGILACHNLVQNHLLNEEGYVTGNLAVSGLLVGIARSSGLSWDEIGLVPGDRHDTARLAGSSLALAVAGLAVVSASPRLRPVFGDERIKDHTTGEALRRLLFRFPLGTALFEEVAFRGVLSGLLNRLLRPWAAELVSACVFGLWHVIPTRNALRANPASWTMREREQVGVIAAGCAAAMVGGLVFSGMRQKAGSLIAPWLAHTSFNCITYAGARRTT